MNHNINNILTNTFSPYNFMLLQVWKMYFSYEVAITTFVCMTPINRILLFSLFNIVLVGE